ncbi:asparagine synthase (glutamine-hydrolyzing) [Bradyrhizobium sp. WBOS7]|uniref:asparagine synthase (glutamine-hydrolyzing) n=1 Tax=Bradyrhizobium betae TaxID=244734 RepID=A0AAE9NFJ9_9BRAD|nr:MULTISPECIES: asparagine synthase (glutamine-hydrolyzing) [Bradyrhizobium]MDD1569366.1 asparagine synthase (glutamine-hydrolyzing) [Bradyrhizobium sp. WBOS1]UUO38157.1 asparagine synthase (glutamine-hydrolyzing) [Bradyrhizobium sp. WBOS01]MDD1529839.1 asparagine synthase (glutamine-hydrolyzing) [Bradyrhizobium sp. WBOS2]MDD1576485.1 asparagine synthase (glutamine-hydrolyzing) [Bradyrhizobium sp. WBOS7]MDD1602326.1 asparagine synthase (glutamine-hydrolyzing) [Bradyrhizobium sp. WBOS16]
MCGLVGGLWKDPRAQAPAVRCASSLAAIAHRGPDASGEHFEAGLFLGHRRLSIIDLDPRSTQPMHAGPFSVVFNGEIYNYRELRADLEGRGCIFRTDSDTEVLLTAFALDGLDCLNSLEGMFSFAVWDREERRLTLVRDRFGEKPMVYLHDDHRLLFASEIPAIQVLSGSGLDIDQASLPLFFRFSYLPAPYTPFKGMRQLRPGHWLQLDLDSWEHREGCYYHLPFGSHRLGRNREMSFEDAKSELRRRLTSSVRQRFAASDVPVATFLSGGLDSSIVSSIAAQTTGQRIAAYSIGFPNEPEFDESPYAKLLASRYPQLEHHVIDLNEEKLADFTDRTLAHLGEPYADASLIPTAFLCSHVTEKVILGGDGADEIFAGYGTYSAMQWSARMPPWLKALATQLPSIGNPVAINNPVLRGAALFHKNLRRSPMEEYLSWRSYARADQLTALGLANESAHDLPIKERPIRSLHDLLALDIEFNLPADMLKKVDLASMQHGLEVRLPYLDSSLVEFALNLPANFLIMGGRRKHLLRESFRDLLPLEILERRKRGFLLPIRKWMKNGRMRDELVELSAAQNLLDGAAIRRFADRHRSGLEDLSPLLWSCYVYLKWQHRAIKRPVRDLALGESET